MKPATLSSSLGHSKKGDVLGGRVVAAIQAAKRTSD